VLDSHPDVVSAEETQVFRDEAYLPLHRGQAPDAAQLAVLQAASVRQLQQSRADYFRFIEALLGTSIDGRLLVDKNPSLTSLIPAMVRVFPEAKFLVALRDPRDVCMSCFMQPLPLNQVSASFLTIEGTVDEYASVMGLWGAVAPVLGGRAMEVRYEDLVNDVESSSRRVLEFLGLAWNPRVLQFDQHARQKVVRSPTYAEVTKPVFKGAIGRWRNYEKYLQPCLDKLQPFVKAFGYE
jgi:Sulfotransferase family